jgi:hypothetical protein
LDSVLAVSFCANKIVNNQRGSTRDRVDAAAHEGPSGEGYETSAA